jgi:ribulose-phosphate 3-epimerase
MPPAIRIAPMSLAALPCLGEGTRVAKSTLGGRLHLGAADGRSVPGVGYAAPVAWAPRRGRRTRPRDTGPTRPPAPIASPYGSVTGGGGLVARRLGLARTRAALASLMGMGKRAGVVLNRTCPVSAVENLIDTCDLDPVMVVTPGSGGLALPGRHSPRTAAPRRPADDGRVPAPGHRPAVPPGRGDAPAGIAPHPDAPVAGKTLSGPPGLARGIIPASRAWGAAASAPPAPRPGAPGAAG